VVAICFFVVVFDGYDLIVHGASVPDLLAQPGWHLNPSRVGGIASWTLFGMLLGALGLGGVPSSIALTMEYAPRERAAPAAPASPKRSCPRERERPTGE
jgi:hypothetical protein